MDVLNVVGERCLFSVPAMRLTIYMMANKYVHGYFSAEGQVPGVSGCLEHISVLTQLPKETNAHKRDMTVLWLDLAYVYRTVPYKRLLT